MPKEIQKGDKKMSCHNIGHALNHVQEEILKMYENAEINKEMLRKLLVICTDAVGWCDGNGYEATETFDSSYCTYCLDKLGKDKTMFSFWNVPFELKTLWNFEKKYGIFGSYMCETCFEKAMRELGMTDEEIEKEKRRQIAEEEIMVSKG